MPLRPRLIRLAVLLLELHAIESVTFDAWSLDCGGENSGPDGPMNIGDAAVIGLGAVGNGPVWTLGRSDATGGVALVDDELVDLAKLQRYVLASVADMWRPKG